MPVLSFPFGPLEANGYLLHNGKDAIVADPPDETGDVLDVVKSKGLTVRAIVLTHLHFDHVSGAAAMSRATGLPLYAGKEDADIKHVMLSRAMMFGLPPVPEFEVVPLAPGLRQWGTLNCSVLHVPGHSPGSLCFYFADEKALLSGDVLFYRSVGRSDLPGGDGDVLCRSLRQSIYVLPGETVVYPGHGEPTTVGEEAAANPFCKA